MQTTKIFLIFQNVKIKGAVAILCLLCVLFFAAFSCRNSPISENECPCENDKVDIENIISTSCGGDRTILKILDDEPAIVQKKCFDQVGEAFFFRLVNRHSEFAPSGVLPVGEIPEQFRQEGLSVYISGNVIYRALGACYSDQRLVPTMLFELTSIKINK